jgi:threonine dehydratase
MIPSDDSPQASPALTPTDYLKRILTARVYEVAQETPLDEAHQLSARLGVRVLLKREDLQPVFSFKLRGAYNCMAQLDPVARGRGVIAASAGNHAQGVALAAQRLGCRAVIVMPVTTPQVKIDAVWRRGAEVVLRGDSYSEAYEHALALQAAQQLTFVHPFDDPDVIAGQGTIGMELLRQNTGRLDAIFIAIGGGGLAAGIATYVKQLRPEVRIIGVQTMDSNAMAQSIAAGKIVELAEVGLFSDGTAVKRVGTETLRLCSAYVDEIILVDTDAICAAIKDVFQETRSILEPAGALAVAGLKAWVERDRAAHNPALGTAASGAVLIAIACGANMNFDRLRFVSERAEIGEHREAVFAVTIPEERGSFRRFCAAVGAHPITEFNYRIADARFAHVFIGVSVADQGEARAIAESFERQGFATIDLSNDELAKLHLRHLVGGRSSLANDELLYRFEFPERPGALMRFLDAMNPAWNISLFHYRNHGADPGRVLVGLQVPDGDKAEFEAFLHAMGYPYTDESDHPAYRLFLA